MKHQEVSVDYWAMGKAMVVYGAMTVLCWIMLRLFNMVFTLPGKMKRQQQSLQDSLTELQRRYPDLNITEEDLKEAQKDYDEILKENDESSKEPEIKEPDTIEPETKEPDTKELTNAEDKKTN